MAKKFSNTNYTYRDGMITIAPGDPFINHEEDLLELVIFLIKECGMSTVKVAKSLNKCLGYSSASSTLIAELVEEHNEPSIMQIMDAITAIGNEIKVASLESNVKAGSHIFLDLENEINGRTRIMTILVNPSMQKFFMRPWGGAIFFVYTISEVIFYLLKTYDINSETFGDRLKIVCRERKPGDALPSLPDPEEDGIGGPELRPEP